MDELRTYKALLLVRERVQQRNVMSAKYTDSPYSWGNGHMIIMMDGIILIQLPICSNPQIFYYKSKLNYERNDKAKAINRLFGIDESCNVCFTCDIADVRYEITQEFESRIDIRANDGSKIVRPFNMPITHDFAHEIFTLIAKHVPDVVPQLPIIFFQNL
jgi:hypothetical protein